MIDMRDLILEVAADLKELMREVILEITQPQTELELKRQWATMPQELKDRLAQEHPEEYKALIKHMKGATHATGKRLRTTRMEKKTTQGY